MAVSSASRAISAVAELLLCACQLYLPTFFSLVFTQSSGYA